MKKLKKKISLMLALTIVLSFVLSACSGEGNYQFDVPSYDEDMAINIGVWNGSHYDLSETELSNLQAAGVNLLVGTYTKDTPLETFIDQCAKYELNVIADQRPWNGMTPSFINKDNFWGFCVYDEPFMDDLQTLAKMKQEYMQKMGDRMFYVNLNPSYADLGTTYEKYVEAFVDECGLDMVSVDNYSLMADEETGEPYVRGEYLYDLDVCSYYAREEGLPFWYTLLTTGHLWYINPTAEDMVWQMNLAMTYGAQYLLHYIYSSHESTYLYPMVDMEGNPTETYDKVSEANAAIRAWDHIYMNFDWIGTSPVEGTKEQTGLFDYLKYSVDMNKSYALEEAESNYDVLVGHFEDEDERKGYMVTNATNPYEEKTAEVSLRFSDKYKGALVVQNGEETVVNLKNGRLSLELPATEAVFVIPLKAN